VPVKWRPRLQLATLRPIPGRRTGPGVKNQRDNIPVVILMTRFLAVVFVFVIVLAAAGCDSSSGTPTTPTDPTATSSTQVMSAELTPGATPMHMFTLPGTAPLHMLFGSLTDAAGLPVGSTLTLAYGVPNTDETVCNLLTSATSPAALQAQINVTASSGKYCVVLQDTGAAPAGTKYSIRVVYGTPSDETSAGTITYTSTVLPGGSTSRSFGASAKGTATFAMDTIVPPAWRPSAWASDSSATTAPAASCRRPSPPRAARNSTCRSTPANTASSSSIPGR
jgi:hypothetical protein